MAYINGKWVDDNEPAGALLKQLQKQNDQFIIYKRNQEYHMEVMGMKRAWQESQEDNLDATHPIVLDVYIPPDTKVIQRVKLRLRLKEFRGYTKTSAKTNTWVLDSTYYLPPDFMELAGNHGHGGVTGPGGADSHTHPISTDGNHAHGMISVSHDHDMVYGIFVSTPAANVTVTINGTDRTSTLGGPFNADQGDLDITNFLTATGWNTISIGSSALGRIHATVFVETYLP